MEETKQTITNLTARLIDEETSLNNVCENENALAASGIKSQSHKQYKKYNVTCYNCKKKGHYARNCRMKRNFNGGHEHCSRRQGGSRNSQGSAFTALNAEEQAFEEEALAIVNAESVWLMDSGASRHMSPNRNLFTYFRETSGLSVKLGNDQQLSVLGIGTIQAEKFIKASGMTALWKMFSMFHI